MMNRCKFLNLALNTCGISNGSCQFMADPYSCTSYDEDKDRSYVEGYGLAGKSPIEVAQAESHRVADEVESLTDFAGRIEGELDGMGIRVVREEIKDAPDWF